MVSIIIATLALLFSIFTYVTHDRKLKMQEKHLNEYQLRALAQGEEQNKKAIIRAKSVKTTSGKRTVYIINKGKAKARNLTVAIEESDQVIATRPNLPVNYSELLPDAPREIVLHLAEGDNVLTLNYTWDDDFGSNNQESQTIDL